MNTVSKKSTARKAVTKKKRKKTTISGDDINFYHVQGMARMFFIYLKDSENYAEIYKLYTILMSRLISIDYKGQDGSVFLFPFFKMCIEMLNLDESHIRHKLIYVLEEYGDEMEAGWFAEQSLN